MAFSPVLVALGVRKRYESACPAKIFQRERVLFQHVNGAFSTEGAAWIWNFPVR